MYGASTRMFNSAVVNNTSAQGGGVYNEFWAGTAVLNLVNCTVAGNAGSSWLGDPGGGGLHIANGDGDVSITNSIIWGNTSTGGGNQIRSVDAVITSRYSNIQRLPGQPDVITIAGELDVDSTVIGTDPTEPISLHDPQFLSPPTNYALSNGPNRNFCIDSGDNLAVPQDDLDVDDDSDVTERLPIDLAMVGRIKDDPLTPKGNAPRGTGNPLGACEYVDMGAYEYGTGSSTMTDCNFNSIGDTCDLDTQFSLDCNQNLIPDECEPPPGEVQLTVEAVGSRFLRVSVSGSDAAVALRVTGDPANPYVSCVQGYVQDSRQEGVECLPCRTECGPSGGVWNDCDGCHTGWWGDCMNNCGWFGDPPHFRAADDWQTVYLGGYNVSDDFFHNPIMPDALYTVEAVAVDGTVLASATAVTWIPGETDGELDIVEMGDIVCVLAVIQGNFTEAAHCNPSTCPCSLWASDQAVYWQFVDVWEVLIVLAQYSSCPQGCEPDVCCPQGCWPEVCDACGSGRMLLTGENDDKSAPKQSQLVLRPRGFDVPADGDVLVDVFLAGDAALAAVQLALDPVGGATLRRATVEEHRSDFAFAGRRVFQAFDPRRRFLVVAPDPLDRPAARAEATGEFYLATFRFRVDSEAGGELRFLAREGVTKVYDEAHRAVDVATQPSDAVTVRDEKPVRLSP